jgi:hypothetical protein
MACFAIVEHISKTGCRPAQTFGLSGDEDVAQILFRELNAAY